MMNSHFCYRGGKPWWAMVLLGMTLTASADDQLQGPPLTLSSAIGLATTGDPWLAGSRHREQALADEAVVAGTLPDPRMSLMAGNVAADSLDFRQEPMTQLSVGISQMFPRGDSLALSRRQKRELASQEPLLRHNRQAEVAAGVTRLWLEAYRARQSIRLIENDRPLFEHLVDLTRANYASALGRTRQQDLIRAQLELTRLDDRLTVLRQQEETARQRLGEWIGGRALDPLPETLPAHEPPIPLSNLLSQSGDSQALYQHLDRHPALRAFDRRIDAVRTDVALAREKYKPEWGISAQYGYRDEDLAGNERADLVSLGLTFDLPLFTANRQDRQVGAASARAEAVKTDRQLMARQLVARLETAIVQLKRLDERHRLYAGELLPGMAEQAQASLTAYDNDDGDFAEVVRARIAELNARIDALGIAVERQQVIAELEYLLAGTSGDQQTMAAE